MTSIPIDRSRLRAIDRIIKVLQEQLPDKLAAMLGDPDLDIADLHLPAPVAEAYRYFPKQGIADIPKTRNPMVWVYPSAARTLLTKASSGPLGQPEFREMNINVTLVYKADGGSKVARLGRQEITADDVHWLRSEIYLGAIIHVLKEFACEGESIHKIDLVDDLIEIVMPDTQKVFGVSDCTWTIQQKVMQPRKQALPPIPNDLQFDLEGNLG